MPDVSSLPITEQCVCVADRCVSSEYFVDASQLSTEQRSVFNLTLSRAKTLNPSETESPRPLISPHQKKKTFFSHFSK